jgi:hypothetical protein
MYGVRGHPHVCSNGLANIYANDLPACKIHRIYDLVKNMCSTPIGKPRVSVEFDVFSTAFPSFWIDNLSTICAFLMGRRIKPIEIKPIEIKQLDR